MSNIPPPPGAPGLQPVSNGPSPIAGGQYYVQIPGMHGQAFTHDRLSAMAIQGIVKPGSLVQVVGEPYWSPASAVPGVFSEKSYIAAMLLAWFLGVFGVDRFYLGYSGLGLAKLFTFGGLGIWALIDFVLIALRKVPDRQGKPLS